MCKDDGFLKSDNAYGYNNGSSLSGTSWSIPNDDDDDGYDPSPSIEYDDDDEREL